MWAWWTAVIVGLAGVVACGDRGDTAATCSDSACVSLCVAQRYLGGECRDGICLCAGPPPLDADADADADGGGGDDTLADVLDVPDDDAPGELADDAPGFDDAVRDYEAAEYDPADYADRTDAPPPCLGDEECDDGLPCNGLETCTPDGCVPGSSPDCRDATPCTVDRCDDTRGGCVHIGRDTDGDTFMTSEAGCDLVGGTDCNDYDPLINPGAAEVCTDNVDNDCDGLCDCGDVADCPMYPGCIVDCG